MKNLLFFSFCFLLAFPVFSQGNSYSFVDFQRTLARPGDALKRKEDTLKKQFAAKNLDWPARFLYIRSFKYDGQLEIWVKNEKKEKFKLFKSYKVCALAGTLGPKRMQGDYQVPEGFYYINEFNPNSNYYLSLGINYPNASDKILSDSISPGGDIYIHGSCVTVGCIPVTDQQIDEIYILAAYAKNQGQDFIPVHIFPVRYNNKKSADYLANFVKKDNKLKQFTERLESVYDHFEITHQLPVIMTNKYGEYVFDGLSKKVVVAPVEKPKREPVQHRHRNITELADAVHQWPVFPGGGETFLKYLEQMGKSIRNILPEGKHKANVMIEFIVDADGTPTNFKVLNGVNEEFDDELITVLEQMPVWQPAMLHNKPVAKKMKQSFVIE
ncbi:MAG: energy transducer TonB [Flavisolibacter sp.]|jgi:murein L,D-transpeptidase YafK|nr:energy transducer TonB [Flavisolibacter sp.]